MVVGLDNTYSLYADGQTIKDVGSELYKAGVQFRRKGNSTYTHILTNSRLSPLLNI